MKIISSNSILKGKLELGEIKFWYRKKDGSLREARGTTKLELIPENLHPKGETKDTGGVPYFDLDVNQWRSILMGSDIDIESDSLLELPGMPLLSEEEIHVMLWNDGHLQDLWLSRFINLIADATAQDASELLNGKFKSLIRTIKKYQEDDDYKNDLDDKWSKLTR